MSVSLSASHKSLLVVHINGIHIYLDLQTKDNTAKKKIKRYTPAQKDLYEIKMDAPNIKVSKKWKCGSSQTIGYMYTRKYAHLYSTFS